MSQPCPRVYHQASFQTYRHNYILKLRKFLEKSSTICHLQIVLNIICNTYGIHAIPEDQVPSVFAIHPQDVMLARQQRQPEQHGGMYHAIYHPIPEHLYIEQLSTLRRLIQFRVHHHLVCPAGFVKKSHRQRRQRSEQYVVQTDGPPLEKDLPRPARVDGKPQLDDVETNVLVEAVEDQFAHPRVVPSSVDEEQPQQKPELRYAVVRGTGGL